jgi:hypothetical protein
MSGMKSQLRQTIRQKIIDAQSATLPSLTLRDVWLPAVKGKALAIIGMRRAGKTSFLWQQLAQRHTQGTPREALLYFSFEDERKSFTSCTLDGEMCSAVLFSSMKFS